MKSNPSLSDETIKRLGAKREEVIAQVLNEFSKSDTMLREWKGNIITYYELYQMVQKKKHYDGLANIFVPETLRAVETIVGKIYGMIFGQPDWMEFAGRDNNGDDGPAIALTQLCRYQMEENNFKARVMDSLRQMVIAGLTVRKVLWDFEQVTRTKADYDKETGVRGSKPMVETVRDTWTFEPVDLLTFQISDINIPYNDVQKAKWIGEQYVVDRSWVNERIRKGWFSAIEAAKLDEIKEASDSQATQDVNRRLSSGGFATPDKKDKVEIIEKWGLMPCELVYTPEEYAELGLEEGDLCECVIVIGNKVAILKLEKNPFWHRQKPYVVCPYVPKEFELPGMGAAQIARSLQEEINDTRNQTMDNKTMILATMWLKSNASGIKNEELTIRPNGVIRTNDINGLVPLRPPIVYGHGLNIEGVAKNDLREAVGASSNLQGIAQAGVDTATESQQINREALGRLILTAQLYAELVLKPTFVFAEYLNYQFYDHIKVIRIVGPTGINFRKLKPEELEGGHKDVIIKIALDATENPAVMRQQLMGFFTGIQQMPPEAIKFHFKLLDKIYGMFFNGHKLDELYPGLIPENPEDMLTPENERDLVLAEQAVVAKKGMNHDQYLTYLVQEFRSMRYSLTPLQFELFTKLIQSHQVLMEQELQEQHMQMLMMDAMQQQEGQSGGKGGVNKGSTKNTTSHNQTKAPSSGSLGRELGG